jgi:multiple sugar transport system permease protein
MMTRSKNHVSSLRRTKTQEKIYGTVFVAPLAIGYLMFIFAPLLMTIYTSMTNWSLLRDLKFIGLENFRKILFEDKVFWKVAKNTLYFSMGLIPLNMLIAFGTAVLLKQKLKGMAFFRTAIFTPVLISSVVWAIIWKFVFGTEGGLVNMMLKTIGITGPAWLYSMKLTMPVVIVTSVLKNVGVNIVIFLSALYNVNQMYYEAAMLDGANKWQQMKRITIPLITPTIFMLLVVTMINSLKVFGQIYVLTGGGPGDSTKVLVYYIYEEAFKLYEFGYASAVALILFVIILALTVWQWKGRKRWVQYED